MNKKPPGTAFKKVVATALTVADYEKLLALAKANKVKVSVYLRSIVVDILADEQ